MPSQLLLLLSSNCFQNQMILAGADYLQHLVFHLKTVLLQPRAPVASQVVVFLHSIYFSDHRICAPAFLSSSAFDLKTFIIPSSAMIHVLLLFSLLFALALATPVLFFASARPMPSQLLLLLSSSCFQHQMILARADYLQHLVFQ